MYHEGGTTTDLYSRTKSFANFLPFRNTIDRLVMSFSGF